MSPQEDYSILIGWLKDRGHTPEEIDKVLQRVREYERQTQLDSVMDSIGNGSLSLEGLIKEALGE